MCSAEWLTVVLVTFTLVETAGTTVFVLIVVERTVVFLHQDVSGCRQTRRCRTPERLWWKPSCE
jgi:hypothetical protein